jgi:pimeloyl-ACP methyl ester carboxylesterase
MVVMNDLNRNPRNPAHDPTLRLGGRGPAAEPVPRPVAFIRPAVIIGVIATFLFLSGSIALGSDGAAPDPCPAGVQCGKVTVPLDRSDPSAETIDIAYALVPRRQASRPSLGTIVTNPGGPGQSTIASAGIYLGALAPLLNRRDLLLVDPRGTGRSGALSCPSVAAENPVSLDQAEIARLCAQDLGPKAQFYGSAAVADDIEAVRQSLNLTKLDLWGDSYGTFLMPVYAARHPEHVRSIVLDGAFPIDSDPWGRDVLAGMRRVIARVCRSSDRCSGQGVLRGVERLALRLRQRPVIYRAYTPGGRIRITLDERELANLVFGGGDPEVYGFLPAAVNAALDGDFALLKRLETASRAGDLAQLTIDPSLFSIASSLATSCHDYPRAYDLSSTPAERRSQYEFGLAAIPESDFAPFSGGAWLKTGIDAGPKCLDWPASATAGSPVEGLEMPDVPVLVQSGGLDSNTPIEQGRAAAARFSDPIFAIVPNAGHTPDTEPCGVAMAIDFVKRLTTDPDRCRGTGRPPAVAGRPAGRAGQLRSPGLRAPAPVRLAVRVALATVSDAISASKYNNWTGRMDALRGGSYLVRRGRISFIKARVVADAVASGTRTSNGRSATLKLRISGSGVRRSRLRIRTNRSGTRVAGSVGRRPVNLVMPRR